MMVKKKFALLLLIIYLSVPVGANTVSAEADTVSKELSQQERFTYLELVPIPIISSVLNVGAAALLWGFLCKNNNTDVDVCIGSMVLAVMYSGWQFYSTYLVYRSYAQSLSEMPNMLAGPGVIATLSVLAQIAKKVASQRGPGVNANPAGNN